MSMDDCVEQLTGCVMYEAAKRVIFTHISQDKISGEMYICFLVAPLRPHQLLHLPADIKILTY